VLAWATPGPRREPFIGTEDGHVDTDLRDQAFGHPAADPRDRVQEGDLIRERGITRSISVESRSMASSR
jgi:hypothetical protein